MNMLDLIDHMTGPIEVPFTPEPFSYGMSDPFAPCEDSTERTACLLRMVPNDTYREEPSPLDFGSDGGRSADSLFWDWLKRGW